MTADPVPRASSRTSGTHPTRRLPAWLYLPAALGVLVIVLPPVALLVRTGWAGFADQLWSTSARQALVLSLVTASATTVICVVLGVPMAMVFARHDGLAVRVLRALVLLPLVLPPVVGGIALLYTFGRMGVVGTHLRAAGLDIAFTPVAVVLAQTFVALPFLVLSVEGALRVAGTRFEEVAATLGASPSRTLWRVTVPLVAPALLTGGVLAFARAMGEFGATITFAGNAPGRTRTAPLAIYTAAIDDPASAVGLSVVLVVVSMVVVVAVHSRRSATPAGVR